MVVRRRKRPTKRKGSNGPMEFRVSSTPRSRRAAISSANTGRNLFKRKEHILGVAPRKYVVISPK